nr:MAG TPA: hypothetical protein [Caudoviricetes sp.]
MTYFDKIRKDIEMSINNGACAIPFIYQGEQCGLSYEVSKGVFTFYSWFGDKMKDYGNKSLSEIFDDPFFDGHSLKQLINERKIEIDFC